MSQEIMLMKQRVEEMEREAKMLRELQAAAEQAADGSEGGDSTPMETEEDKNAIDGRSVYVGNVNIFGQVLFLALISGTQVDYGATPEEIQAHFQSCGTINRVTILCDKFTGHPKGYVVSHPVGPGSHFRCQVRLCGIL
jgi:RNA recognition motif-containing protein